MPLARTFPISPFERSAIPRKSPAASRTAEALLIPYAEPIPHGFRCREVLRQQSRHFFLTKYLLIPERLIAKFFDTEVDEPTDFCRHIAI